MEQIHRCSRNSISCFCLCGSWLGLSVLLLFFFLSFRFCFRCFVFAFFGFTIAYRNLSRKQRKCHRLRLSTLDMVIGVSISMQNLVPHSQYLDRVAHVPAVSRRQVPTIQTAQKTVEVPQSQLFHRVTDVHRCRSLTDFFMYPL